MPTKWINSQATFVCLDTAGKVKAIRQTDISQILETLGASGLESAQYLNEQIPSMAKLIDDIEATGSEFLVFYCLASNYILTKIVSCLLKEADPSLKTIWFGPLVRENWKVLLDQGGVDLCVMENPVNNISLLLTIGMEKGNAYIPGEMAFATKINATSPGNIALGEIEPNNSSGFFEEYRNFFTGLYSHEYLNGLVEHLAISPEFNQLKALQQFCSINSSVLIQSPCREMEQYRSFKASALVQNYYYHHLYQVVEMDNAIELLSDDGVPSMIIHRFPYTKAQEAPTGSPCLLTIETPEDLKAFLSNAQHWYLTGSLKDDYELRGIISNTCRWLGRGHCPVQQLPRLTVDTEGNLYPCKDCHTSIGNIRDNPTDLKGRVKALVDNAIAQRDCTKCNAQDYCSQCTLLPSFLSPREYCSIMRERPYLTAYLQTILVLRILQKSNSYFKDKCGTQIKIATGGCNHFIPNTNNGNGISQTKEFVYLFIIDQGPILFDATANKMVKISPPLAAIFEALTKGIDPADTIGFLSDGYKLSGSEAHDLVEQALYSFKEANLLLEKPNKISIAN